MRLLDSVEHSQDVRVDAVLGTYTTEHGVRNPVDRWTVKFSSTIRSITRLNLLLCGAFLHDDEHYFLILSF